jgi:hypothetical protein
MRRKEFRSQYESSDVTNFSWDESLEDGHLVERGEWTTPRRHVELRIATPVGTDGSTFQPGPNGSFVRKQEIRQARRSHQGSEDVALRYSLIELSEAGPNQTSLFSTSTTKRTGYSWSERAHYRMSEGQHRTQLFQGWLAQCESDIAATPESG